jgi:antitoxin (DNA-binding transcriptional repressor) of toxin-antitoxin stability system
MMADAVDATQFKARRLDLLDQVGSRQIGRLEITERGKVVAILVPPPSCEEAAQLHGFMRGSVIIPDGVDLTASVLDAPCEAGPGILHG